MKRNEAAKYMMISDVCYYFEQVKHVPEEIIKLNDAVNRLNNYNHRLKEEFDLVKKSLTGFTTDKHEARSKMIDRSLKMTGLMEAKCMDTQDATMLKAVHCSYSDLNRTKDDVLVKRCEAILNKATRQKKSLYAYGLKEEMLNEANALLVSYREKMHTHKKERGISAAHHALLRSIIKDACQLLKYNIDTMMELLKDRYPNECGSYKFVRKVICYGRKRKAYGGRFKDKLTGETLKDVHMSVIDKAEKIVTDFKNELNATAEEFTGKVTVVIEKAGYKKMILQDVDIMQLGSLAGEMEREDGINVTEKEMKAVEF